MEVYGVQWDCRDKNDSQYDCAGTMGDLFANRADVERQLKNEAEKDYKRYMDKYGEKPTIETDAKTGITTVNTGDCTYKYWIQSFNLNT